MHGYGNSDYNIFFTIKESNISRGHNYRLVKKQSSLDINCPSAPSIYGTRALLRLERTMNLLEGGKGGEGGWGREGGEGTEGGWGERVGRGRGGEREDGERGRVREREGGWGEREGEEGGWGGGRGGRGGEGRGGEGRDDGYTYCNRYVH